MMKIAVLIIGVALVLEGCSESDWERKESVPPGNVRHPVEVLPTAKVLPPAGVLPPAEIGLGEKVSP